ncbi:LysM peptidoglycan-binding domain-containing protein [Aquimarina hainanensis]|uniref:LysM peptidoglycan-binding domain-containing protein n=1 Tax=Aquimarina hainanensis TaxID=1578017 RepID=UPI0036173AF7
MIRNIKTHLVEEEGDTVYSISKKYGITPEEIYKLNPEARDGINNRSNPESRDCFYRKNRNRYRR